MYGWVLMYVCMVNGSAVLVELFPMVIATFFFSTLYRCWLDERFVWFFVGPVVFILLVSEALNTSFSFFAVKDGLIPWGLKKARKAFPGFVIISNFGVLSDRDIKSH